MAEFNGDTNPGQLADTLIGTADADTISGFTANDSLVGGEGGDLLDGGPGNDTARGDDGDDTLLGGDGRDVFFGGAGSDTINGGGGLDRLHLLSDAARSTVRIDLQAGTVTFTDTETGSATVDFISEVEEFVGGQFADTFIGAGIDNTFSGLSGADSVLGAGGVEDFTTIDYSLDHFHGGTQGITADLTGMAGTLTAGAITDAFGTVDGVMRIDRIRGSVFSDSVIGGAEDLQFNGFDGSDTFIGGGGFNEILYNSDASTPNIDGIFGSGGIDANLSGMNSGGFGTIVDGYGDTDFVSGIESVRGTNTTDIVRAPDAGLRFRGLNGADTFIGSVGVDAVDYRRDIDYGGGGGVIVNLSADAVTITGQGTLDAATARDGFGSIDRLKGALDATTLVDNAWGTDVSDTLIGSTGANTLNGQAGADSIDGGAGGDSIVGSGGNDSLVGGEGNDTLDGGGGTGDLAIYSAARNAYTVTSLVGGGLQIAFSAPNAQAFTDTVTNVETFRFADGDYTASALLASQNNPPSIAATLAYAIDENLTQVVASLPGSDPDPGTTLTYSIVGGADQALFSVNASTGALSFVAAPNFEAPDDAGGNNVYDVNVQVSDGSLSATTAIAVTVSDVAEVQPTVYTVANATAVAEGGALSFVVTRSGPTPAANVTYTLTGSASAPGDYTSPGGTVSFAAGQTQATVTLQTLADGLTEGTEGVTLTLVNATAGGTVNAGLGQTVASGQITDVTGAFVPFDPATGGAANLASAILAGVPGLTINAGSVTYTGASGQGSFYDGSIAGLGIGKGVLLTSGDGTPPTSNTSTSYGPSLGGVGDQDLTNLLSTVFQGTTASFDANVLSFTFTVTDPNVTSISLNAIFASDEYPDFVDNFVDVAAVFVNGTNYAFFESANRPLSLLGDNITYFRNNASGTIPLEYDGISIPLTVVAPVVQGLNTIKIAVADTRDSAYDSALFISSLSAGSDGGGGGIQTPPVYSISGAPSVTEGGTLVFTITRDRDDSAGTVSYSLSGTAGAGDYTAPAGQVAFAVGELSKQVSITTLADATGEGSETVIVTLTSATNGGLIDTGTSVATGTILDGNQPPVIAPTLAYAVAENTTAVATLPGSDPDAGTTLIYSIVGGADAALFAIDAATGALSFVSGRNFEAPSDAGGNNVYDVQVQVSDGSLSATTAVAVTVTNVNETPTIAPTLGFTVAENTTAVTASLPGADPDAGTTLTYAIVGGADAALFGINASTGALSFLAAPDFEAPSDAGGNNVYDVQVQVSDGSLSATTAVAVTVTNVNETPTIAPTLGFTVAENTTAVATLPGSDPDAGTTLIYSIVGGADASLFAIDAATGALSFLAAPDFEAPGDAGGNNVYDVQVRVSDGTLNATTSIAVTVSNTNQPPVIAPTLAYAVAENTTAVATLPGSDPDAGTTLIYSIVGGADAALFAIDGATGALSFVSGRNFEAPSDAGGNNVYDVQVQVSDGSLSATTAVAVTVTNVNETPTIAPTLGFTVAENTTAVTASLPGADPDAGTTLTYAIVGGADAALFGINASTGALSFLAAPDFEAPSDAGGNNVYDVQVRVSDGTLNATTSIAVTVSNTNQPPVIAPTQGFTVAENATAVTNLPGSDADAGTTLVYSIVGGADAALFAIDGATGALSFVSGRNFEAPSDAGGNNVYDVQVQVSDGSLSATTAVAVTVTNVNETPTIAPTLGFTVAENTTAVTASLPGADPDAGTTLTYAIVGGADAALFGINASTGALSFLAAPDFEAPGDAGGNNVYDVQVRVSDGTLNATTSIAVTVSNQGDLVTGAGGDDTLFGLGGAFTLAGAGGNDVYVIDSADDVITENPGQGTERVYAFVDGYTLAANVENLVLDAGVVSGSGNAEANEIGGNGLGNVIDGAGGADTVTGEGGNDSLVGGAGNDQLFGGDDNDSLSGGDDLDRLVGGAGLDTLAGGSGNDTLWGEAGNDSLVGDGGDDQLLGQAGNDTMAGGSGNDNYALDDLGDVIIEAEGEGIDTVFASIDGYVLAAGLDALVLVGGAVSGSGNAGANLIFGTSAANVLSGGAGSDTLVAGEGADSLVGGTEDDWLFGEGGNDTLDGGDGLDQLIGGGGNDLILGGLANDLIWGEGGNDTLDGGAGADLMGGGAGDDVYVVTEAGDAANEVPGEGIDTVLLGLSDYLLGANIENVELLASGAQVFGNELANRITGNAAANTIVGGAGADTLDGGAGNDILFGETGGNVFLGGAGSDTLVGSTDFATDVFQHRGFALDGLDYIYAYDVSQGDVIDIASTSFEIVDQVEYFSILEGGVEIVRVYSDLADGVLIA